MYTGLLSFQGDKNLLLFARISAHLCLTKLTQKKLGKGNRKLQNMCRRYPL